MGKVTHHLLVGVALAALAGYPLCAGASSLVAAEYFVDADPALGSGTPVAITSGATATPSFTIVTDGLDAGFHTLFVRFQDDAGVWGMAEARPFYLQPSSRLMAGEVTAVEYFIDTDPGAGAGTVFAAAAAATVELTEALATGALSMGFHTLFVRAQGTDGEWGVAEARAFCLLPPRLDTPAVGTAEYFVDDDPGFGAGVPLTLTAQPLVDLAETVVTSGLDPGFHTLFVRAQEQDDQWGLTEARAFYLVPASMQADAMVAAEYFVDVDPGVGQATTAALTPGAVVDIDQLITTAALAPGFHTLFFRAQEAAGDWGLAEGRPFFLAEDPGDQTTTVVEAEYFIDADPGFGAGTQLSLTPGQVVELSTLLATAGLDAGFHTLFVRGRNSDGFWGLGEARPFYLSVVDYEAAPPIAAAEYFYDTDPGFGAGTPLAIQAGPEVELSVLLPADLDLGTHTIMVRAQSSQGVWGLGEQTAFSVGDVGPPVVARLVDPVALGLTGPPYHLDMEAPPAVFHDPDSGTMIYAAASADPTVATVAAAGGLLTITPVGAGFTTVSVQADDGDGVGTATAQFSVAVAEWLLPLQVQAADLESMTLGVGRAPGATDALDVDLLELELEEPPSGGFDARLMTPGSLPVALDLRPSGPPAATWRLSLQADPADYPLTLAWNRSLLPAPGSMLVHDAATDGAVLALDMRATQELTLGEADPHELLLHYADRVELTMQLPSGWSLVSVPLVPDESLLASLFPNARSAFAFDSGYQEAMSLDPCAGYWVNLETGGDYALQGTAVQQECFQTLPSGWSLIGAPYPGAALSEIHQAPAAIIVSAFRYAQTGYESSDTLAWGSGYWLNLSEAGTLDIPQDVPAKTIAALPRSDQHTGTRLWAEAPGGIQEILLGAAPETVTELPPPPPAGVFDARVDLDGIGAWQVPRRAAGQDVPLLLQGGVSRLYWESPETDQGRWQMRIGERLVTLQGHGAIELSPETRVHIIAASPLTLPGSFALAHNYPNPFNPTTTIRYDLSAEAHVLLRVYDAAGQLVRTLVSGPQPAGSHSVVWDGRTAGGNETANGVYFCELRAGGFRALRKMALIK
jgi:hypothetical protein